MEVASYPVSRIHFRYRSTFHDLPTLNIELVVEVGLKWTSPDLSSQFSPAPEPWTLSFLVLIAWRA